MTADESTATTADERRQAQAELSNELFCAAARYAILSELKRQGVRAGDIVNMQERWPSLAERVQIRTLDFVAATGALVGSGILAAQNTGDSYELTVTERGQVELEFLPDNYATPDGPRLRERVSGS
ncbi:hypothetical protein [Abyssibacter sp.]|jgi:hypothetical protein|uniref:hypothetical protein n=1 Tax=Abyssibacter sp. TaxID=2320200 RepID=UPI0035184BF7